jgi:hypothetical protein
MSSGTMTLEASTTAYATQAGTGAAIKAGDATRTLVGMARTDGSTAWADSATQRFVRSWFNDPGIALLNGFTTTRSTSSTSWVEINSEIRIEFLSWSGETVQVEANGVSVTNTVNDGTTTSIGFDGTTAEDSVAFGGLVSAGGFPGWIFAPFAVATFKTGLSEGYHYATLLGAAVNGGTGSWLGAASNATAAAPRCTLRGALKL